LPKYKSEIELLKEYLHNFIVSSWDAVSTVAVNVMEIFRIDTMEVIEMGV
jgi:hypothetical protein